MAEAKIAALSREVAELRLELLRRPKTEVEGTREIPPVDAHTDTHRHSQAQAYAHGRYPDHPRINTQRTVTLADCASSSVFDRSNERVKFTVTIRTLSFIC